VPLDPEDLLTNWQQRVEQQTSLTVELSERISQTTATAESTDGEAVVTVDNAGGLADIRLTDRAMRRTPGELSEIILATSRRAQAKLAQQVAALVKGIYGSDSDTASFITGAYTAQFPEPPDEERTDNGPTRHRA
jgi:DNA-binding protein YbaB